MISLDCETTGVDWRHGARPFFITCQHDDGKQSYYEWDVDPLTRKVDVPEEDVRKIRDLLAVIKGWSTFDAKTAERHKVVGQNSRFDVTALSFIGITDWPWEMTHDTLAMGHLLASNQPHDLTSMALTYLGEDIEPLETALGEATQKCRRLVQGARGKLKRAGEAGDWEGVADEDREASQWAIAEHGRPDMPSCPKSARNKAGRGEDRDKSWKYDTWLPHALCKWAKGRQQKWLSAATLKEVQRKARPWWWEYDDPHHPYWTVLSDYSNKDSEITLALWLVMRQECERRGLWEVYNNFSRRRGEVAQSVEVRGMTLNRKRLRQQRERYAAESNQAVEKCVGIASQYGHDLKMPKGDMNDSLRNFCFGEDNLGLPVMNWTEGGQPSLNKQSLDDYLARMEADDYRLEFVKGIRDKRGRDKAVAALDGYEKFLLPIDGGDGGEWCRLHPSLNPTGTDHLRWSSNNPNSQNVSKREGFNLRWCFGPAPGREWWSLDAANIELRIPAYCAGEKDVVWVFDHPNDPPYYGSYHLVVFDLLHPELFKEHGKAVKTLFESTWYQWCKNGTYCKQYGGQRAKVDATYHVRGADEKLEHRFPRIAEFNRRTVEYAQKNGLVETIPDRNIDPDRGYPLIINRTEFGRVEPTKPFNYKISGTACQWMGMAMFACEDRLREWRGRGFDGYITAQVHDELVFDLPRRGDPVAESKERGGRGPLFRAQSTSNLWRVRVLQRLMERCGNGINVPTPVSVEYHSDNWSEGVSL